MLVRSVWRTGVMSREMQISAHDVESVLLCFLKVSIYFTIFFCNMLFVKIEVLCFLEYFKRMYYNTFTQASYSK